ncbi:MAG TPA: hypothetical protein VFQ45_21820 [Longimicrobium sp.]|nr:hypothetical protein [Longimicrobium sp.]
MAAVRSALAAAALLAWSAAGTAPAAAQEGPGTAAAAAAVRHLEGMLRRQENLPAGTIRLDRRVLVERQIEHPAYAGPVWVYELAVPRDAESYAALRRAAGAEPGNVETARVCAAESLRTCTLGGAVAVFAAGDAVLRGDTADVLVKVLWLSESAKQPVHDGVFRVTLVRESCGWRVAETRTLNIS